MSFFFTKIPSRASHYIQLSHLLRFLLAVVISQTFHVSDDLDSFERDWSGIFQDVPQLGFVLCFFFFLMIRLGLWNFVRKQIMSYQESAYYQHDFSLLMFNLIIQLKQCLSGFSTVKLFLIFPFPICYSLKGIHNVLCTLKKLKLYFTSLRVANVQKLFGILLHERFVSFVYVFVFTYIRMVLQIFILYSEL